MKSRKCLRKLILNEEQFLWQYYYDDLEFTNYPFSYYLIVLASNRKFEIRVLFNKLEPPMLLNGDKGMTAIKDNREVNLNLNEPKNVKDLIEYLMKNEVDFEKQKKWLFEDGEGLFEKMGYQFDFCYK